MPIIKSAKKAVRQNIKHRKRNYSTRERYKTSIHELTKAVKKGTSDKLPELLEKAYSEIDTAFKKKILHKNNAARKKSRLAKMVSKVLKKGA